MSTFLERLSALNRSDFSCSAVRFDKIDNENDLWYAVAECRLTEEQQKNVNPAGFSIGRAYLRPQENFPCVIRSAKGERVGFINLQKWLGEGEATSFSYMIDKREQGKGYGKNAAALAVRVLKAAFPELPVKIACERKNLRAQELYLGLGFERADELDGDDLVFIAR